MLSHSRNNEKFALTKWNALHFSRRGLVFHSKLAFYYKEQLVFMFVVMPDKLTSEFHELDMLAIQFSGDLRRPVL